MFGQSVGRRAQPREARKSPVRRMSRPILTECQVAILDRDDGNDIGILGMTVPMESGVSMLTRNVGFQASLGLEPIF